MIMISRALIIPAMLVSRLSIAAFNPGGWKMTADGKAVEMKDGNPIWVDANGGEQVLAGDTITRLNGDAKKLRERAEAAETSLAAFKDIDPVKAKDAITMIDKIDKKKLIDAGEVDRVTAEIKATFTTQITELQKVNEGLTGQLDNMRVDSIFDGSEFVKDRVAVPADMFKDSFRRFFKVKDGKIEAYDKAGNRVMSKAKVGDYADASEALEILVEQHPQKDTILKASTESGGGNGGGGGGRGGKRTMTRKAFEELSVNNPGQAALDAAKMRTGELVLTD